MTKTPLTNSEFLAIASEIGHYLRSAGPCPSTETWNATKDRIKTVLERVQLTGAEFDARIHKIAGRSRVTKLERMGL